MMKQKKINNPFLTALVLCCALAALQTACAGNPEQGNRKEGNNKMIEKPIHDYVESWYNKDAGLMKQALHPAVTKRHPDKTAPNGLRKLSLDEFLKVIPQYGGPGGDGRIIDISVYDSANNIATAKVISNSYVDYVHLGYVEGRWQIINILWDFKSGGSPELTDELKEELSKPVRDYVEGWYDKDAKRFAQALHPDLAKRNIDQGQPDGVNRYKFETLLADLEKYGGTNGKDRTLDIEYLDIQPGIASLKVVSASFVDYLHLARQNGRWLIVNALWAFR